MVKWLLNYLAEYKAARAAADPITAGQPWTAALSAPRAPAHQVQLTCPQQYLGMCSCWLR